MRKPIFSFANQLKAAYAQLGAWSEQSAARRVTIRECETVCLALGPYRNLTTLTAATLFLHPHCQVLNHAGARIYGNSQVDFLSAWSPKRFERFVQLAITLSNGGERGDLGGSITHSHAFDAHYAMKERFTKTGLGLTKESIHCLFWKESLHTSNLLREKEIDLATILQAENRLRFLLPIRNPMDCAISNIKSGTAQIFRGYHPGYTVYDTVAAILDEIHWFAGYQARFPNRFFHYLEHSISREMLVDLADFLKLSPTECWLADALSVMVPQSAYEHDSRLHAFYAELIEEKFGHYPTLRTALLAFTEDKNPVEVPI